VIEPKKRRDRIAEMKDRATGVSIGVVKYRVAKDEDIKKLDE